MSGSKAYDTGRGVRWSVGVALAAIFALHASSVLAADVDGVAEHPMFDRYPGQEIRWQQIENYRPFKIPTGPVVGYRKIGDWVETEGRVTRTFYRYQGTERTFAEIYRNYLDAIQGQGFEVLGHGFSPDRKGAEVGSRAWTEVYFQANPATRPGEVGTLFSGTSSSGGAGAIVATKDRASGRVYVVGHTDSVGSFSYNAKLSADRARAVVSELTEEHGVSRGRLEPHGVGPLSPVFSNGEEAGRERNRRVELVERQDE